MMTDTHFKGPGHWRSQAAKARGLDDNVFAQMAEMHRRLTDKGHAEAAALVAKAQEAARAGMTDKASDLLREAASLAATAANPAHAHAQGLREMAETAAGIRPGTTVPGDEGELPGGLGEAL